MNNAQTDLRLVHKIVPQDAEGADLDKVAAAHGLVRDDGESDDQLRTRIFNFVNTKALPVNTVVPQGSPQGDTFPDGRERPNTR